MSKILFNYPILSNPAALLCLLGFLVFIFSFSFLFTKIGLLLFNIFFVLLIVKLLRPKTG